MKATRVFQLTALALVVVAALQVGWWLFDQRSSAIEKVRTARALYSQQIDAAQALLASGVPPERVQAMLPGIVVNGGRATLAPAVDQMLLTEAHRRINQYAWEGSFFLLALGVCIGVIARALRAAQISLWKEKRWRGPHYWAAFTHKGRREPLPASYTSPADSE